MAIGSHTYAGSTPTSPAAIQSHFISEVFQPAMRGLVDLARFSKKVEITGKTYNIPSYKKLDIADSVVRGSEDAEFRLSRVEFDGKSADLSLQGNAIEFDNTFVSRNAGVMDVISILKDELQQEMKLQLDKIHKNALDAGNLIMTPTGYASQQVDVGGTPSQAAAANLSVYHFQYLRLLAGDTYAIPMIKQLGAYAYLTRGKACFALKRDPEFQAFHQGIPSQLQKGLVAEIDGIKIYENNEEELFLDNLGTNSDVAEGVLLGDEAMHMFYNGMFNVVMDRGEVAANHFGTKGYIYYKADLGVTLPTNSVEKRRVRHIRVTSS